MEKVQKEMTASEKMYGDTLQPIRAILDTIDQELGEMLIEGIFNQIYGRESKLDLKIRELCTITLLCVLGKSADLTGHLNLAFNVGWTYAEIKEAMMFCILPAGWPTTLGSLRTLINYCESNNISITEDQNVREDYYKTDWSKIGNEKGIQLFSKDEWQALTSEISLLDPALAQFFVANHYGKLYTRTILDERTKCLCMISAFAALKSKRYLKLHIIGAPNCGVTETEIEEILFHIGIYAGQEAVLDAIEVYKSIAL